MSTLTVVTSVSVVRVRRRAAAQVPLRLSPLLRHALATATAREDGKPNLLPTIIPARCAHDNFHCKIKVQWRVGDGRNRVFFCDEHYENLIQAFDAFSFDSERWTA